MDARTRFDASVELDELVDLSAGWLDRRIFWEEWIYQLELERLFARSWLFVAHESQLPNSGDFLTTYIRASMVLSP